MFSNIRILLPGLFLILQFVLPALPVKSADFRASRAEPHDFRAHGMDCRSCHKIVGIKTSGGLVKPVQEICNACHNLSGLQSHPVGIKPSFALPRDFPLDEHKMMTCATCHDPHKTYRNALSGEKTMYLRREAPKKDFCRFCHKEA